MPAVLITGANRGLGLDVVARIARSQPETTILLGTRSVDAGHAAIQKLAQRKPPVPTDRIRVLQLDVTSDESVRNAAEAVKRDYPEGLAVVYNNAGIINSGVSEQAARDVLNVNYYGVKRMIAAFNPLIVRGGRNVVVSSAMGAYATNDSSGDVLEFLKDYRSASTDRVDALVERYLRSFDNTSEGKGFPDASGFTGIYATSKAFVNVYLRNIAPEEQRKHGVIVTAVCPGYCSTELNANSGPRRSATGARSIVLASEVDQPGTFWRDGEPAEYNEPSPGVEAMAAEAKVFEAKLYSNPREVELAA